MSPFENVVDAIHGLSFEEKLKLRMVLEDELKRTPGKSAGKPRSALIGLLADEPELADEILESAMTARETRALRMPGTQ